MYQKTWNISNIAVTKKPNYQLNNSCEIILLLLSAYQKENKDTFIPLYSEAYVGLGIFKTSDHEKEKNCWLTEKILKYITDVISVLMFNQKS